MSVIEVVDPDRCRSIISGMTHPHPSRPAEIEVIEAIYAAINRNDIAAVAGHLDPEMEWIEPPDFPTPGTYRGIPAVLAHITRGRSTWAEGGCELEGFFAGGDKIVVFVRAKVRLKGHTEWLDGPFADGWILRDGKAVLARSFGKRRDGLVWAGIDASGY